MRQHPLMIRWCITKYYLSASPYNQLFCNKLSSLKPLSGFNPDILNKLMRVKIRFIAVFLFFLSVTLCFDESRLNQIQFIVIRQIDCQDLQKWGTLMMSFVNFKTLWKVKFRQQYRKRIPQLCFSLYRQREIQHFLLHFYIFCFHQLPSSTTISLYIKSHKSIDAISISCSCICL